MSTGRKELHLLLIYCRQNFQTIICLFFFEKFIRKTGVLSTGAESKTSNEERAFDSEEIVGRLFLRVLFSPCDDAATSAWGEWKPRRGESTQSQASRFLHHMPVLWCLLRPRTYYLYGRRARGSISLVLLSSIPFPGRTPYLFLSRLGYYMNVPSSHLQHYSPTFTRSLTPRPLPPFSFGRLLG